MTQLLALAEEFQALLDGGQARSRAELARRFGLTRARVTQVFQLLDLAPELKTFIKSLGAETPERMVTERKVRHLARLNRVGQLRWAEHHIEGFTMGPKVIPMGTGRAKVRHA